MASFTENIRKIRGEAIYGPEMREAIAEAIEQSGGASKALFEETQEMVNQRELFIYMDSAIGDNYTMRVINAST